MEGTERENSALPVDEYISHQRGMYESLHRESLDNPEEFWNEHGNIVDWYSKWDRVLDDSNAPFYRWFLNGKMKTDTSGLHSKNEIMVTLKSF